MIPIKKTKSKKTSKKIPTVSFADRHKEIITTHPEHPFINASRSKNHASINFFLSNPYFNPNIQTQYKNTAIHHSAIAHDYVGLQLLLNDHRTDASIKNIDNRAAFEFIDDSAKNGLEMRQKIFAQGTLDKITNEECASIKSSVTHTLINLSILNTIVQKIKLRMLTEELKQSDDDKKIPLSTRLPDHVTDEFIVNKIWFQLSLQDS